MSTFRQAMTEEEQKAFLTGTRLYLARDIRRTRWTEGVFSLRHMPTGRYLRVSADGLYILGAFGRGMTVAEVAVDLIRNRRCPSLRTLYAFIVEARARNILVEDPAATFPKVVVPRRWPSLAPGVSAWIRWSAPVCALLAIFFQPSPLPDWGGVTGHALGDVAVAFLLLSLSASTGSLLASMTVLRLGGEVRRPAFKLRTWLPRLGFDWSDTEIGGPRAIEAASVLRIAPMTWAALLCALCPELHAVALPVTVGMLLRCGPVSDPVRRWLQAHWRNPLKRTVARRWFFCMRPADLRERIADLWEHDSRYALRLALVCFGWSAAALALVGKAATNDVRAIFAVLRSLATFSTAAWLAAGFALLAVIVFLAVSGRLTRRPAKPASAPTPAATPPTARALFDVSLLFRALPPEVADDLALGSRTLAVPPGAGVVGLGDTGEDLYVVRSGEFEVVTRSEVSGDAVVMRLRPGDVFGELSLFGELMRPHNVRAVGPSELCIVTSPDIQQTLMRHLSLPVIEELVQRRPFFRGLPLLAGCDRRTTEELVRMARFETMEPGRTVGSAGRENRHFSFVYTGSFDAGFRGRKKERLLAGAAFGEVSMLAGDGDDVYETNELTRRLVIPRDEFVPILGRDPELALRLEEAASRRIGRPVLPYRSPES